MTRRRRPLTFALLIALVGLANVSDAAAVDWPAWRGPHGDGRSDEEKLPTRWSATDNVHWKVSIPGKGHSSPIVWGERIFLTTAIEADQRRMLLCLNRLNGQVVWEREVLRAPLEQRHGRNSYASATPATDGKHVYVSFLQKPSIQLVCYDLAGNEVWRKSPGTFESVHGFCSSPVLCDDLVILNCDQDAKAWIVAYDKASGQERWRTDRPNRVRSYCTPLAIDVDGSKQLVLSGSKSVVAYAPQTGAPIWNIDGPTEQLVASLAYEKGVVFVTGGYPDLHMIGIDPRGRGNVTDTHVRWRTHKGVSYVPSPVAHDGHFFVVSDNGIASCLDARTGQLKWKRRLGEGHSASALAGGGHVYFLSEQGETFVVRASSEFTLVAENPLDEACFASPAAARGQLFIRTAGHLYCIGKETTR
jgi:outer membrane protein assembly factor BamB